MKSLRPYQVEAKDALRSVWRKHRSALLVLATGTGKTYLAADIARARLPRGRVLWLAHRSELLDQAAATFERDYGIASDLERAESRAPMHAIFGSPVVVATVQTMRGARLRSWPRTAFATIVVDEAHHATARSYRDILDHFSEALVLGLTATPDRGDKVGLGNVFDEVAYEYGILRGIDEGYLSPVDSKVVYCDEIDISSVKVVDGDLKLSELVAELEADPVTNQIAASLSSGDYTDGRSTVIFTASVKQAESIARSLVMLGETATHVDGKLPAEIRAERLAAYAAGDIQYLANCAVLTEGWDAPRTSCVVMARPTKSRALYTQCVGRGTRLYEGKENCLVVDFVGVCGKHSLVNPISMLAGRDLPPDVEKRAKKLAEQMPALEALREAEAEAAERARRADEALRRGARVRMSVATRIVDVDPFDTSSLQDVPKDAATMRDVNRIRERNGLCTVKQALLLRRRGLRDDLSKTDASKVITAMAQNGWRVTSDMMARFGRKKVS